MAGFRSECRAGRAWGYARRGQTGRAARRTGRRAFGRWRRPGVGPVDRVQQAAHGGGGLRDGIVAAARRACRDCAEHGAAQRAGLPRAGHADFPPQHIGIDLQHERVFVRDAAAGKDRAHGHARLFKRFDDGARAKGGGLHQRAVDFLGLGAQRHAQDQAREMRVHQDGAVAVPPVQAISPLSPARSFAARAVRNSCALCPSSLPGARIRRSNNAPQTSPRGRPRNFGRPRRPKTRGRAALHCAAHAGHGAFLLGQQDVAGGSAHDHH